MSVVVAAGRVPSASRLPSVASRRPRTPPPARHVVHSLLSGPPASRRAAGRDPPFLFKMLMVVISCASRSLSEHASPRRLPNPTLTLTFKRRGRAPCGPTGSPLHSCQKARVSPLSSVQDCEGAVLPVSGVSSLPSPR